MQYATLNFHVSQVILYVVTRREKFLGRGCRRRQKRH